MKKWFLRIFLLLAVIVVGVFFYAKTYLTKDYLVAKLEKSINSRVQVGEFSISLLGKVELKNVIITDRDELAETKVPHDERESLDSGAVVLDTVSFRVSLMDILSKKAVVENITIDGMQLKMALLEDGSSSIEKLFAKPPKEKKNGSGKSFNAKDNDDFVTSIESIDIKNVDLELLVEETQLQIKGSGVYLNVTDINVNPDKLDSVNNAQIQLGGVFDMKSLDRNLDYGHIVATGTTELSIFNDESGDLEPDMKLDLLVGEDSYFTTRIPVISELWKVTDSLAKFGIDKVRLPEKAEIKNNQKITVAYKLGKVTVLEDLSLHVRDWEAKTVAGSWFNTGTGLHHSKLKLYVATKLSGKVMELIDKSKKVTDLLGKIAGKIDDNLSLIEDGKVVLSVETSGLLSKPKVSYMNHLMDPLKNGMDLFLDKKKGDSLKDKIDLLEGLFR